MGSHSPLSCHSRSLSKVQISWSPFRHWNWGNDSSAAWLLFLWTEHFCSLMECSVVFDCLHLWHNTFSVISKLQRICSEAPKMIILLVVSWLWYGYLRQDLSDWTLVTTTEVAASAPAIPCSSHRSWNGVAMYMGAIQTFQTKKINCSWTPLDARAKPSIWYLRYKFRLDKQCSWSEAVIQNELNQSCL